MWIVTQTLCLNVVFSDHFFEIYIFVVARNSKDIGTFECTFSSSFCSPNAQWYFYSPDNRRPIDTKCIVTLRHSKREGY